MLQGYIVILIGEMKGRGMHVPSAPFIPSRDPSIQRNETKYMPVPLDPTCGWGFAPILDWARGLTPRQASFQTLGWVLSSSIGRASPSFGLVIGEVSIITALNTLRVTMSETMIPLRLAIVVVS